MKLFATFASVAAFITLPVRADYSNTVASFSPVGYWRFDETAASPALNTLTNAGSVGSAGHGIISRAVTKGQSGKVNNAILLNNGGSGISCLSKVDVPYTPALNPTPAFSVEFWAKPTRNGDTLCAISSINCMFNGGSSRTGWLIYQDTTRWQFRLGGSSGYAMTTTCSSAAGSVVLNAWQHVVATYDGTTARLYLNGVLAASLVVSWSEPNTYIPIMMGALPLTGGGANTVDGVTIAAQGLAGYRGFDGYLDEVAIYPVALSAARVTAHFNAASTPATYGTVVMTDSPRGYWNFDEPTVTPPNPATYPYATNSGSVGSALDGPKFWGSLAAQAGASATPTGFGAGNKSVFFDGDNGYISLGDDPAMHFSGNITMMAWVKPNQTNHFRNIIGHGWDENYRETFLRISQGDDGTGNCNGNVFYEVGVSFDGTGAGYNNNVARFSIPAGDLGNWVFIAGTYDGSSWNLYRNGDLVASTVSANGAVDVTNRWSIGSRSGPSSTTGFYQNGATFEDDGVFFNGAIDEPAVFTTALSGVNIKAIYDAAEVKPAFARNLKPQSGNLFAGDVINNDFWAQGSGTLSYLWLSNGVIISGATATNISFAANSSGALTLSAVASNAQGSTTNSVTYTILTPTPPSITSQPANVTRYFGYGYSVSVVAVGSPVLTYQWRTNGTAIAGATSPTYSGIANQTLTFDCIVTNNFGRQTSSPAILTTLSIPSGYTGRVISSNPIAFYRLNETSGSVAKDTVGGRDGVYFNASLNVPGYAPAVDPDPAASFGAIDSHVGSIPGCFTWTATTHTNFTIELWANGPGGQDDESTLVSRGIGTANTTANEQFGLDVSGGVYRFFTRGNGNALFECFANVGPNDTWQHIVCVYDDLNTTGGGALKMYIYVNGEMVGSGDGRAAGLRATTDPVSIGAKRLGNDPAYNGFFTGTIDDVAFYGYAFDAAGVLSHYGSAYGPSTPPLIDIQPANTTNYSGLPITLRVDAHGTVPLTYQWKKNGIDIIGANSNSLAIPAAAFSDIGSYRVGITNGVNPGVLSAVAYIDVLASPTAPVAIPGLVLHLPFDDNLTDTTGRGNNGAAVNLIKNAAGNTISNVGPSYAVYAAPAALGTKGIHFETVDTSSGNATNWDNRYISLGDRADLHFSSNANFSVSFWVKYDAGGFGAEYGDLPFLATGVGSTFATPGLVFAWTYGYGTTPWIGGWAFSVYDTAGVGVGGRGEQGSIDDGNWHHLVHVFDRVNGNVNYLDGKPVKFNRQAGTAAKNTVDVDSGQWFTIGQDPTGSYVEPGSGALDDLGIWKRALTPLEAASLYAAGANGHSFIGAPFTLKQEKVGANVVLTWDVGVLQEATNVNGPYTDMGNRSPLTVAPTGTKFYRIRL